MRFKSILAAFIVLILVSIAAVVSFIQTEKFGRVASKVVSDIAKRRFETRLVFETIELSFFPPGLEINQVKIQKKLGQDDSLFTEVGKIGFYVGLFEFEEKKISIGEILIADSVINYQYKDKNEPPIERIEKEHIDKIFGFQNQLPFRVDKLLIENAKIILNHEIVEAKRLKILKQGQHFLTRFQLANLKPLKEKDYFIDEMWGDVEIGKKDLKIQRIKIQHNVHSLLIKGKVRNWPALKNSELQLGGESSVFLANLKNDISIPESVKIESGFAHFGFRMGLKDKKISGNLDASITDLDSNFLTATQIIGTIKIDENMVSLSNLSIVNNNQKLIIHDLSNIFDLKNKKITNESINVGLDQFELENLLKVSPSLKMLRGEVTGNLSLRIDNNNLDIKIRDGFVLKSFRLVVGSKKPFTIMNIKKMKLDQTSIKLVKDVFFLNTKLETKNSKMDINGFANSNEVSFVASDSIVDFEDFGNLVNLDIKGKGPLELRVFGPNDDLKINLIGKTEGFGLLGYKFGNSNEEISISLADSSVAIKKLESIYKSTPISGNGTVNFETQDIDLDINSSKAKLQDLKEVLDPIFAKMDFFPGDMDFNAQIRTKISGKTSLDELKIKSKIKYADLFAYGEGLSGGEFDLNLINQQFSITHFKGIKGKGFIAGDFFYHLTNNKMELNFNWNDLSLQGFNIVKKHKLNLNGVLSGSVQGEGRDANYSINFLTALMNTKSQDYVFDKSEIRAKITPQGVSGSVALLGDILSADFKIFQKKDELSKISLRLNAPKLKPFTSAILGQHIETEDFTGSLKLRIDTSFRRDLESISFLGNLEDLTFNHENFHVNYKSNSPQFIIEENHIKKWSLSIQEQDLYLESKGKGGLSEGYSLVNDVHFNSKVLEILTAGVLSSEGFIRNLVKLEGRGEKMQFNATSKAQDLNLTLEAVPFPLNNLSYSFDFSNNRLILQEFRTSLENGTASLKGDVFFDNANPDINIKYTLDKAEIPVMGKSLVNVSGEGVIIGNDPPYSVGGEIGINKAQIINELTDFSSKTNALSNVRFLPPSQESPIGKLINLNINVKTENPIRITNSLMDISLTGEIMLSGSPTRLKGDGNLHTLPNSSRVFFKNNEYFITDADLNFSNKKEISNPDFDISALTFISSYKINAKAYGDLERFNFDLTSDPALPRNSILSLIAFGYSDEIQNSLTQQQQQNLTQVGMGSFVFDRFKISDILNKQFGLQVNLGTVFEQSQTASLLSGRNQDGQGALGRTRTATKIELKKRLDEALNLSVSSTMGGSIGQRQSMNLNYSVNKKVQLEGVYEMRTNDEGQEDVISTSIGGDLKFRWTFK
jgi:translocation and assembly module TamB